MGVTKGSCVPFKETVAGSVRMGYRLSATSSSRSAPLGGNSKKLKCSTNCEVDDDKPQCCCFSNDCDNPTSGDRKKAEVKEELCKLCGDPLGISSNYDSPKKNVSLQKSK